MKNLTASEISDELLDEIISRHRNKPGFLLSTLEEVQESDSNKYLSREALIAVARKLEVPYAQVYSVATFYSFFNLKPQGDHSIIVCRGTACHTKGSKALLDETLNILGVPKGDADGESSFTTSDSQFTIKTVACFGQCALSPVVSVDGIIYSNINSQKLLKILDIVKKKTKISEVAQV